MRTGRDTATEREEESWQQSREELNCQLLSPKKKWTAALAAPLRDRQTSRRRRRRRRKVGRRPRRVWQGGRRKVVGETEVVERQLEAKRGGRGGRQGWVHAGRMDRSEERHENWC